MDFAQARHNMVEGQIRTNRVTDPMVVDVLEQLPREAFLSDAQKPLAYIDEDLVVAPGRILMEPMVLARLMQAASIDATDLALVVAAATGYEAAAISKIASAVVGVETYDALIETATAALSAEGADTVTLVKGDLTQGYADQAPYDVIFVNGAVAALPSALGAQLAEGGRMVYVKAAKGAGTGKAMLAIKADGVVSETELFDANVPALSEFAVQPGFAF